MNWRTVWFGGNVENMKTTQWLLQSNNGTTFNDIPQSEVQAKKRRYVKDRKACHPQP